MKQRQVSRWSDRISLLRPHQWVKNLLLFAGYIFAGNFKKPIPESISDLSFAFLAMFSFCFLSGGAYSLNDARDKEKDSAHPVKRHRPVASGRISRIEAIAISAFSFLVGLTIAVFVAWGNDAPFFLIASAIYPIWGVIYSLWLKQIIIVDALGIATGFVLRVVAGCLVVKVVISPWLILCTLLVSLFIAFCKRRHELFLMGDEAVAVRSVLGSYSIHLLDAFIAVTAAMTIMAYSLYTFIAPHVLLGGEWNKQGQMPSLMLTIPFVIYGVFRYLYLTYRTDIAGTPERMISDKPFILNVFLWGLTVLMIGWLAR